MRSYILATVFILLTFQAFAQNEMDTRCMKTIKEFSVDVHFPKFTGLIIVSKDTIRFDSSVVIINDTGPEIKKVFELGLIFPKLIYGASTTNSGRFEFKKNIGADTLRISNVQELQFPNQRPETRCFSFLLWQRGILNPCLYLFELTNERAKSHLPIKDFIQKADVTAFGFCSILI